MMRQPSSSACEIEPSTATETAGALAPAPKYARLRSVSEDML
jgi:hypothetical protein